jgi:DNA-directed RNA polymerase subunit RPC12/RpoP
MTLCCVTCHGPLVEIGSLGDVTRYRCRDCGGDQWIAVSPPTPDGNVCTHCGEGRVHEIFNPEGRTVYRCNACGGELPLSMVNAIAAARLLALEIQDAVNPLAVANVLVKEIREFSRRPEFTGTRSVREDPALRAIAHKLADLFGVADFDAWDGIAKHIFKPSEPSSG